MEREQSALVECFAPDTEALWLEDETGVATDLVLDWLSVFGIWTRVGPAAQKTRDKHGTTKLYENFEALAVKQGKLRSQPIGTAEKTPWTVNWSPTFERLNLRPKRTDSQQQSLHVSKRVTSSVR